MSPRLSRLGILLGGAFVAIACSPRAGAAGRYTHASDPSEWIELHGDGGFVARHGEARTSGTWELRSGLVTLSAPAGTLKEGRLDGRFLVTPDGDRWVRRWPAGRYVHERHTTYFVDLRPDGSYHYARGPNDHRGRYEVNGASLTLWYPSDGKCSLGGDGPAVPSPGLCAFRAELRRDRLTFFRLKGAPGHETREPGEELVLQARWE